MRAQIFYDCPKDEKGQPKPREDGHFICPPFYGAFDPFSAPYDRDHPMQTFGGLSGGQLLRTAVIRAANTIPPRDSLERMLYKTNHHLDFTFAREGMGHQGDKRPGASFVFCKDEDRFLELAWGGDTRAVWIYKDGRAGITSCTFIPQEKILRDRIARLKKEQSHTGAGWPKGFHKFLCESRRRKSNVLYPILNGQPNLMRIVRFRKISTKNLLMVVICTDGMLEWNTIGSRSGRFIAQYIKEQFDWGIPAQASRGFSRILSKTREAEIRNARSSHVKHGEATCIVLSNFNE